jgi:hypothetical protein
VSLLLQPDAQKPEVSRIVSSSHNGDARKDWSGNKIPIYGFPIVLNPTT